MAAYRRVYDSRHLQADCQEHWNQLRNPTLGSRVWATVHSVQYTARFSSDRVALISGLWMTSYLPVISQATVTTVKHLLKVTHQGATPDRGGNLASTTAVFI